MMHRELIFTTAPMDQYQVHTPYRFSLAFLLLRHYLISVAPLTALKLTNTIYYLAWLCSSIPPSQPPPCRRSLHWYVDIQSGSRSGCVNVTLLKQENNLTWLDLSDLLMESSRPYVYVGSAVKLAYRVSASWIMSYVRSSLRRWDSVRFLIIYPSHIVLDVHQDLHSARFQLEKSVVQQRCTLFWQMFLIDTFLVSIRPPPLSDIY